MNENAQFTGLEKHTCPEPIIWPKFPISTLNIICYMSYVKAKLK